MHTQNPCRVMLIDDHEIVREGLRVVLESGGFECVEAGSTEEALALLGRGEPVDVAVVDFGLPGADGLEAIAGIHRFRQDLPVLLLSMQPEEMLATRALRLGAAGYICKASPAAEVLEAVRCVARGQHYVSREFAARTAASVTIRQKFSAREFEVLRLIGAGKTASEIATILGLGVKTVYTYRERLMEKLQVQSNYEIVRYVLDRGLLEGS
jgi:two-component system, NarL family, invasion response regulator UvrY